MEYAVEIGKVAVTRECLTTFINIESSIRNVTRRIQRRTEWQSRRPTFILFFFFKIRKIG
jgi:hypothetical protein